MYTGKTVLITGSSRGVGKGIANHFASNGASVIAISKSNSWRLMSYPGCTTGVESLGGFDLSNPLRIQSLFDLLSNTKIDIVINNAAVLTSQFMCKMNVEDAIAMINTNLLGTFLVSREAAKLMDEGGRIINIGSMAVSLEPMGDSIYAATKAAVQTMTNIMAKEYSFRGITANTLAISAIKTDMLKQLNQDKIDALIKTLPIPRYATIEDILNVIDFYASDKSDYITAQTIYLGGIN